MNYCRKCGMKLKDGVNICPRCKSDQKELEAKIEAYEQEVKAKKKRKKKIITIISCCCAAAVLIAAGIVTYILTRPEAIDLTDFLVVEYTGEDGDATATFSFDTESFYETYGDRIELADEDVLDTILSLTDDEDIDTTEYEIEYLFENFVSGTLSPDSELSVGDYVSFIWDVDEDSIEELYGIEVVYEDQILTVDEITEETSDDDEDTDDEDTDEDADEEDTDSDDAEEDTDSEDDGSEDTGDEDTEDDADEDSTDSDDSGDDSEEETEAEEEETEADEE